MPVIQTGLSPSQSHKPFRAVLDNGIVVLVSENPITDIIAARLFVRAGSRWDPPEQMGLASLLAAVLTKGTDQLSSMDIAEQVESVGASLGADATSDYFLINLKTVSADFSSILALAAELMRSPSFPEAEVALEQRLTLQNIRSQQEQPFSVAFDQLRRLMYHDHPYGFSTLGTEETVSRIGREDLLRYHQQFFRPDNLVISLSGRITPTEAIALIEGVFGDWGIPEQPLPTLDLYPPQTQPRTSITPQATQQSVVMLGYLAAPVPTAADLLSGPIDYPALKLLNTYLGNGLSSRLFVELREKRGLAYDVSAFYPTRLDVSQFVVYMGTAPSNTAIAVEGLEREVRRLRDLCLSEEELQAAKNKLLGQYALGKQTNAQIAQVYGWYETLGLGVEFDGAFQEAIAAVTPEAALAVAQRYFLEPYRSLVGPESAVSAIASPAVL